MKKYGKLFIFLFLFSIILPEVSRAQIGGKGIFTFLGMPKSARVAAVGSNYLPVNDGDINLALSNPSLINEDMHNKIGLAFVDFYSDISTGFVGYSRTFEKIGSFTGSLEFIDYGEFDRADYTGQRMGKFSAGEYAFNVGWGRALAPNYVIGANLKGVVANYEKYSSSGIAVDVAGSYVSDDNRFVTSLIIANIGRQLTSFSGNEIEPMNFDIKLGFMRDLEHVPFKFFILTEHLQTWDLRYDDPNDPENVPDPITGEREEEAGLEVFADNLMRHFTVGGEFSITQNFHVRGGYNYQRRQELKVPSRISTVGFSWGFGFRISKFHLNYSRSTYHLDGSPNYISVTTNLDDFFDKE
ncbi:MAG: type IX secretion system protein PorQ [Bacteroidales bacterium]|nr:type IX secretion system protein PorQ [Bacteroidales bacterium]